MTKFSKFSRTSILSLLVLLSLCSRISCKRLSEGELRNVSRKYVNSEESFDGDEDEGLETRSSRRIFPFALNGNGFGVGDQAVCMGAGMQAGQMGTCVRAAFCVAQGGNNLGGCGQGMLGTCCQINTACNGMRQIVSINGSFLTQPNPLAMQNCQYRIPRQKGVCQIRLDFAAFSIDDMGMNTDGSSGNCLTDSMLISGHVNGELGLLCGDLTGQHMYLDYGNGREIGIQIFLAAAMAQRWNIQVTMIQCTSRGDLAPPGCLQYFTDGTRMVTSFGYRPTANNVGHQLNNQNYAVCIRSLNTNRMITWRPCPANAVSPLQNQFFISGSSAGGPLSGDDCPLDWVEIFGVNRFCGNGFPASVPSMAQPFMLNVNFNEAEVSQVLPLTPVGCGQIGPTGFACQLQNGADVGNTGFCLIYTQGR